MASLKIVVWDNIGNTLLGMRAWDQWDKATQERLLTEDPEARSRVVSFDDLFSDQEIELVWLYDPVKSQRGFRAFFEENRQFLRPVTDVQDLVDALANAEFMVRTRSAFPPKR